MAEFVAINILSGSWKLISTINDVLTRIGEAGEHAQALKFLHKEAKSFLGTVNEGLSSAGDTSRYSATIESLQKLLTDILKASSDYKETPVWARVTKNAQTKGTILQLERRLQFFVNRYLVQRATPRKTVDLDAFSRPVTPQRSDLESLLPDDVVLWERMTQAENWRRSIGTWTRDVAIEPTTSQHGVFSSVIGPGTDVSSGGPGDVPGDQVDDVFQTLEAASLTAQGIEVVPITTSNYQTPGNGRPPSPTAHDWQSVEECVKCVIEDRDIARILGIFSVSKNFDYVLDVLETLYYSDPLSYRPERAGVLTVASKFVSHLWLTDIQIAKLTNAFTSRPLPIAHHQDPLLWTADVFLQTLRKLRNENEVAMQDPIASLIGNTNISILAVELSQALAVLEYRLRRTDPDGECVRWLARRYPRDLLSFPERVEMWVLWTVLQEEMPINVGLRYRLFYKVAKRSKDIHNFSAVRAIMSALQALEQIRVETKVGTTELSSMMSLSQDYGVRNALKKNKPYLQSLENIFSQAKFSIDNIADNHHQIHWGNYLKLREEVDVFTSQTPNKLISPQEYAFGGNVNRVVDFVKKCLINVEVVDDVANKVEMALQRYWRAFPKPHRLFRTEAPRGNIGQSSPRGSTNVSPSDHSQTPPPVRGHRRFTM